MARILPEFLGRERGGEGGGFSISSHGGAAASHDGIIVCRDLSFSLSLSLSRTDGIPKFCFSAAINQVSPTVDVEWSGWADSALLLSSSSSLRTLFLSHRHYVHSSLTSAGRRRGWERRERTDYGPTGERKDGLLNKHRIYTISAIRFVSPFLNLVRPCIKRHDRSLAGGRTAGGMREKLPREAKAT